MQIQCNGTDKDCSDNLVEFVIDMAESCVMSLQDQEYSRSTSEINPV